MEKLFRNPELNVSVRTVRWGEGILFYAKDVAESLGYADPKKAVQKLVRKQNKVSVEELRMGGESPLFEKCHPQMILLYEPGLYQLICSSRLPIAEDFQDWVFKEVLPSIRKTGSYKLPVYCNQMRLINETDLHYAVVEFIRGYHPKALIQPGLGEYQDTSQIQTLISNDYTKIVLDIEEYFRVDKTKKFLDEIKNLKIKCKTLKASQCEEVVIRQIGYTVGKY
ncbi:Hypothetical predicted protein [Paramuricea clavata]|uniref:Uncharacterized protein n=1 Tax=Paramuricea clavata TaxID=317549 RepID=A0A7D9IMY9_PARCT|nr:Hypothetical predicted protein [Paramuricea clavata]